MLISAKLLNDSDFMLRASCSLPIRTTRIQNGLYAFFEALAYLTLLVTFGFPLSLAPDAQNMSKFPYDDVISIGSALPIVQRAYEDSRTFIPTFLPSVITGKGPYYMVFP